MKITLSYLPGEEREADADMMVLHQRHPGSKARPEQGPPARRVGLYADRAGGLPEVDAVRFLRA